MYRIPEVSTLIGLATDCAFTVRLVLGQAQRRQASNKVTGQKRALLTESQRADSDGRPRRNEFASKAAQIGRGISATMGKVSRQNGMSFSSTINSNIATLAYSSRN